MHRIRVNRMQITYVPQFMKFVDQASKPIARPYGTRPHWTLTLMGHCFGLGPKILRYTVLHCFSITYSSKNLTRGQLPSCLTLCQRLILYHNNTA